MKNLIQVIFLMFIYFGLNAQHVFNNTYQSSNPNENNFAKATAIMQSTDSNFVVVGMNYNQDQLTASKLNNNGDTIWNLNANYGIGGSDFLLTVLESHDGNYIVGGISADAILLRSAAILIKVDKNTGDTIWTRKFYETPNKPRRCYKIQETADRGFVFAGYKYNIDNQGALTDNDIYLVKTDSMGIPEWERTYGGTNYDFANAIEITDDGGFMLFGTTFSYGEGPYSMYLIKTDSLGNQLWQKTYGGTLQDYGTSMCKLQDGNYVLAGTTQLQNDTISSYLIKIDSEGTVIWDKFFKGDKIYSEFAAVKQLSSGEIVASGLMPGDDLNNTVFGILYKINETDGSVIWNKRYDYFQEDSTQHYFYGMDVCLDGGLVMAGMVRDLRTGASPGNSMWVVKTDCLGNDSIWDNACDFTIGIEEIEKDALFNLYPNPSTGTISLDYFIPQNAENQSISFYNATGKLVQKVGFSGEGQIQLNIDCSGFSNGVYQCVLVSDGEVIQQRKLVIIQ